jgi:hypothetical protein
LFTETTACKRGDGLTRQFRNLIAIPSVHYDPTFGRVVHALFACTAPAVVALELPPQFRAELEWASRCWPTPVASLARRTGQTRRAGLLGIPFVPGDSIFETYRLAVASRAQIAFVDLGVPRRRDPERLSGVALPGSELARRVGSDYGAVVDAIADADEPSPASLAREAAMARCLAGLMRRHRSVLWVGGLAHWPRIQARLEAGDFAAPQIALMSNPRFDRARLTASALLRLTGQMPWKVARFAQSPTEFDAADATRRLLHAAAREHPATEPDGEQRSAIDVARTSLYARNLASTDRFSDDPGLGELIIAAEATIGPRYAGAVYTLATKTDICAQSASLEPLTYETDSKRRVGRFRFRGAPICIEPWVPHRSTTWVAVPASAHIERTARDAQYEGLPGPEKGEKFGWGAYPPDEADYEAFIRYALRRASQVDPSEARSVPFMSGLEDGLDVRTTIRFWQERRIYVRRRPRMSLNIRNGVIDWRNASESSEMLRGEVPDAGWNDPDSTTVGSVSREAGHETIHRWGQAEVTRRSREWSFVTLDYPTFESRGAAGTLWDAVIRPLVNLGPGRNNIYGWLELVFRFSANKPFVYYSKYTPSPRIVKIARAHNIVLQWCPLDTLSAPLRGRHGTWRQLWMAPSQWRALRKRLVADPFYLPSASAGE